LNGAFRKCLWVHYLQKRPKSQVFVAAALRAAQRKAALLDARDKPEHDGCAVCLAMTGVRAARA
jgi:hypothetical protein